VWLADVSQRFAALQAERDGVTSASRERLDTYLTGSVRMGEELYELRRVVAPLPDKLTQIEQRDPSSLSFTQAARLAGMGASVDDLTQSCGLSKAEAELVSKLHHAQHPTSWFVLAVWPFFPRVGYHCGG
jgi:hypothetical protein